MIVLKEKFTMEPILVALDLDKRMEVNVSDYVTGGVLSIKCVDRKWRLVAYLSKSLNEIEKNYEIHNREMLAVIIKLGT